MSFQLDCPNCGTRPIWEFHYGGASRKRPVTTDPAATEPAVTDRQWAEYLYNRPNICGEETEWWYHRSACKSWFLARRDTRTNQGLETRPFVPPEAAGG